MLLVPTGALVGAVLAYTVLARVLGFAALPTTFFLLLF